MSSRGSSRRVRRRRQRAVGRAGPRFPKADAATPSVEAAVAEDDTAAEAAAAEDLEVEAPVAETPDVPESGAEAAEPAEPAEGHFVDEVPSNEPADDEPEAPVSAEESAEEPAAVAEAAEEPEPAAEPEELEEPAPAAEVPEVPEQAAGEATEVGGEVVGEQEPVVEEFVDDVRSWVRPYVWTGGRTTTSMEFALETLVSARAAARESGEVVRDEHRQVLELCERPRSVSEVAALLSVPLGVAKALLGVMAEQDLLVVHNTSSGADGPGLELMERVLRGLKKL